MQQQEGCEGQKGKGVVRVKLPIMGCFVDRVEKCVACAAKHDESAMRCRLVTTNMAEKRRRMTKTPHCLETRAGGNLGVELVQGLDRELQSLDSEVLILRQMTKALETRTGRNLGVALVQGLDREVKCLVTTNGTEKGRPTKNRTEEGRPTKKAPHCLEMLCKKESAVCCSMLCSKEWHLVSTNMAEKRRFAI
jgi:hypothetical protein